MIKKTGDSSGDYTTPETIDLDVTEVEIARHLARCASCRQMLEHARDDGTRAMEIWRREFARCFGRARGTHQ